MQQLVGLPTSSITGNVLRCCRDMVEKVDRLRQQLADTQAELASLQAQYSLGEKRLARASKLMAALGNEAVRWTAAAEALTARLQLLPGAHLGLWPVSLPKWT